MSVRYIQSLSHAMHMKVFAWSFFQSPAWIMKPFSTLQYLDHCNIGRSRWHTSRRISCRIFRKFFPCLFLCDWLDRHGGFGWFVILVAVFSEVSVLLSLDFGSCFPEFFWSLLLAWPSSVHHNQASLVLLWVLPPELPWMSADNFLFLHTFLLMFHRCLIRQIIIIIVTSSSSV